MHFVKECQRIRHDRYFVVLCFARLIFLVASVHNRIPDRYRDPELSRSSAVMQVEYRILEYSHRNSPTPNAQCAVFIITTIHSTHARTCNIALIYIYFKYDDDVNTHHTLQVNAVRQHLCVTQSSSSSNNDLHPFGYLNHHHHNNGYR